MVHFLLRSLRRVPVAVPLHSVPLPLGSLSLVAVGRSYTTRNLLSLRDRGLVSSFFPQDEEKDFLALSSGKKSGLCLYAGFDPTAPALHVGNLAVLVLLCHALRGGHKVIALIGGATGQIGDPSGKKSERPQMTTESVEDNARKITHSLHHIFHNHEKHFWDDERGTQPLARLVTVNNYDWYKDLSTLDFVGKIGRHFRMGTMLLKEAVKSRIDSSEGLSFTEFTYQIFQAYDWYYLMKHFDCQVQVGGHDQMGNIWAGHDLISRTLRKRVYGLTVPLITSEEGNKYGKTAGNAVWLDEMKMHPFNFYQFFLRSKDTEVEKLLKLFTFKSEKDILAIMQKQEKNPELRTAQKELAKDVTLLVHGEDGLSRALKATKALYSEDLEALSSLKADELQTIFSSSAISEVILLPGTTVIELALKAKCFENERDGLRIIKAGGFSLNYRKINNPMEVVVPGVHFLPNNLSLARVGKKNYYVIKWHS